MTVLEHITGADRLTSRFGGWPSFHDAEVVRLMLDRRGENGPTAEMVVHAWLMTNKVDDRGYYVLEKHSLVRFVFDRITSIELAEFNHQTSSSDSKLRPRQSRAGERFASRSIQATD